MEKNEGLDLEMEVVDTSEMEGKYLSFWTDGQLYGVPIADVVQIVGVQEITKVPEYPYYAKGIINLRGSVIPTVDVRLRFGKMEVPYDEHTCIIVTQIHKSLMGFIVDSVDGVVSIPDEDIAPPPRLQENDTAYLTGIGKLDNRVVLLLDLQRMVTESDMAQMSF